MTAFDDERARDALLSSGSRFLAHAADWLAHHDDPVALLLVLTKETGPALGPWATYRWCAVLGLAQVGAVRALARDILDEEPDHPLVAVDAAFAKAHAACVETESALSHRDVVVSFLARTDHDDVASARLALAHTERAGAEGPTHPARALVDDVRARLAGARAPSIAGPALEAALLAPKGSRDEALVDAARLALGRAQGDDGLVVVGPRARENRFATLRALALHTRLARE